MKYVLVISLACCILSHNYTHAMPHPNQYHHKQTPYLLHQPEIHHTLAPVHHHTPPMQLATKEDIIKISRQIAALHVSTSCGFTSLDSKICLAQRACDVLAQCQHSQDNTNAQTNVMLASILEQNRITQETQTTVEQTMYRLMQQIEQQNEQQKLILSSLAALAQQKVTHQVATQTDSESPAACVNISTSAACSSTTTPNRPHVQSNKPIYKTSKNFLAWQKKHNQHKQASHTQIKSCSQPQVYQNATPPLDQIPHCK